MPLGLGGRFFRASGATRSGFATSTGAAGRLFCERENWRSPPDRFTGPLHPRIKAGFLFFAGLIGLSLAVGLIVGRWWALAFTAALAIELGLAGDFEGPEWLFGLWFGLVAAVATAVGVLVRRFFAKPS